MAEFKANGRNGTGYLATPPGRQRAGKMLVALNIAEAGKDMKGSAEYLLASGAVTSKRVGIVGLCMGRQIF
ncbi:MAG TPA: hypothetical protein VF118_05245 [Gemmatimonadaceae bacterium]